MDTVTLQDVPVPTWIYGTAWKEDRTEACVTAALGAGFRAVDTACQRKHYFEAGVGAALAKAFEAETVSRDDLFLQTKFTYRMGQDHRLPYDPEAPPAEQVHQSFATSLENLGVERVDSYVLHGPATRHGLTPDDLAVWGAMEELHEAGKTRLLGVSNVNAGQLDALCEHARVKPAMVQNRCYAAHGWDAPVREVCDKHGVAYQGFSLLTANRRELADLRLHAIAGRLEATPAQVVFAAMDRIGMLRLTGTTDPVHMAEDLASDTLELTDDEVQTVLRIGLPPGA